MIRHARFISAVLLSVAAGTLGCVRTLSQDVRPGPELNKAPVVRASGSDGEGGNKSEPVEDASTLTAQHAQHSGPSTAQISQPNTAGISQVQYTTNEDLSEIPQTEGVELRAERQESADQSKSKEEKRFRFSFQSAPCDSILRRFADEANLALQMDVVPPGTLSLYDPAEHTVTDVTEWLDILNGQLLQKGFLLVRRDRSLAVVETSKAIPASLIPQVPASELERYGQNELLTVIFPVTSMDAAKAANEIKAVLSPLGKPVALPSTNRLMVTDIGGNLRRVRDLLTAERVEAAQRGTAFYQLKYTNAVEVAKSLNDLLLGRRQSKEPSPTAPPRPDQPDRPSVVVGEITTNSILATGSPEELEEIRRILVQLDAAPRQVVIQALLVEVDLGKADELGVELGLQDSVLFDRSVVDKLVTITQTSQSPGLPQLTQQKIISQTSEPGFNFNNQPLGNNTAVHPSRVGTQGLSNLAVGRINGDLGFGGLVLAAGSNDVSVLIRALAARRKIDILSRPTITALDNRTAQIQIGQQVPVVEGVSVTAVGGANPVIRQDQSGIILKVVPRITPNDAVVIEVSAEKSEFPGTGVPIFTDATTGRVVEAPIKDQTKASTVVSVKSGQTIVLGGMITKAKTKTERKVPCLGDIPVLGHLFRYDSEQNQRKELLIFLTPRVLQSDLDAESIKEQEIGRVHFPLEDAEQMHGPIFNPSSQAGSQDGDSHTGSVTDEAQKQKVQQSSSVNPAARGDSGQSTAGSTRRSRWFKR